MGSEFNFAVDLHPSKALFSLDPDNLQLHCFLGLGALFCRSFFCPLDQPCKMLQTVQVTPIFGRENEVGNSPKKKSLVVEKKVSLTSLVSVVNLIVSKRETKRTD